MQEEVNRIYAEIHELEAAVSRLEARKETALDHIRQLQAKLPLMLTEYATGQRTDAEINQLHAEIQRLQQVANEPVKEAIRPLDLKIKELQGSRILTQHREEQRARARHQQYVDLFNKALAAKELPAQQAVVLENIVPAALRDEVKELLYQFQAYRCAKYSKGDAAKFEDYVTAQPTPYQ